MNQKIEIMILPVILFVAIAAIIAFVAMSKKKDKGGV
jgi:hypothetical protein